MSGDGPAASSTGAGAYAHPRVPRSPALTWGAGGAGRYAAEQLETTLRLGAPAQGRAAPLWRAVGRVDLPTAAGGRLLALTRRRARPELTEALRLLLDAWPDLTAAAPHLPRRPPARVSLLAVRRSVGVMAFLFDEAAPGPPRPLLVAKPTGAPGVERERDALQRTAALACTPRVLGQVGAWTVQEGLAGRALVPPRLRGRRLRGWPDPLTRACRAVEAVGAHTAVDAAPGELAPVGTALASGLLSPAARERVGRAHRELLDAGISVVRHGDLSPQNILVGDGHVRGLVDWESSRPDGVPGFDAYNTALSYLEIGVGRRRSSLAAVLRAHRAAFAGGFYARAHEAARDCLRAAGADVGLAESVGVAFLARRLGMRLLRPGRSTTDAGLVAALVEMLAGEGRADRGRPPA